MTACSGRSCLFTWLALLHLQLLYTSCSMHVYVVSIVYICMYVFVGVPSDGLLPQARRVPRV